MLSRWLILIGAGFALLTAGCVARSAATSDPVLVADSPTTSPAETAPSGVGPFINYDVVVIAEYPHDTSSYTQGLEFSDGLLLESTGRYGSSAMRLVEPETGSAVIAVDLDEELFGEGATRVDDEIWQLTWRAETLIIRDADDLSEIRQISYDGEGWGLCDTGDLVIMSDGSSTLRFRDRASFDVTGTVTVTEAGEPVEDINELECVDGTVWANIYQSSRIIAIDQSTGQVTGTADLSSLVPAGFEEDRNLVLNGIAYQPETGRFWVTGKEWPVLYEIELRPQG